MSTYLEVINFKSKKKHHITTFKSYIVEQSLQIPADAFSFTVGNYNGEVSKLISAGDEVRFYINKELCFIGIIDELTVHFTLTTMDVELAGRDKTMLLLENDCEPVTYNNMTLDAFIKKRTGLYGIKTRISGASNKIKKIAINGGDTEWGLIEKYCKQQGLYARFEKDELVVGKLRQDSNVNYVFSNEKPDAIKIKSMLITVSSETVSKITVYSDDNEKHKGIKGVATDKSPIKRNKVVNEDVETNAAAKTKADELLKEMNREAFVISITTNTKVPLPTNKVAKVVSAKLGLNVVLLIDSVRYTFDDSGSNTTITLKLIENVPVNWANHTIPTIG